MSSLWSTETLTSHSSARSLIPVLGTFAACNKCLWKHQSQQTSPLKLWFLRLDNVIKKKWQISLLPPGWQTQTTIHAQHHWIHAWAQRQNGSQIWEGKGMEIADFGSISAGKAAVPGQQRNLCSLSHHAASNRLRCSWESEQRDLWNRVGTENVPCKPLPGTCHTLSQDCRPGGLSLGTASAHVIQQVGCRPQGLWEMKANLVLRLKCQSHPQNSTSAFPFATRLKAPGDNFFLQVLLLHTHQKEFSYLLYPAH